MGVSRRGNKGKNQFVRQKFDVYNSTVPFVQVLQWWYARAQADVALPEDRAFLLPEEFNAYTKISIEDYHLHRPHLPQAFKVKDYCPTVYNDIRKRLGISPSDLFNSLVEGEVKCGADGQRYMTHDRHFCINLLSREDVTDILRLLRSYQEHIVNQKGATLLPHWAALHRIIIKTKQGSEEKPVYVLVERNALPHDVDHIYHLKGATVYQGPAREKEKEKHESKRMSSKKRSREDIEVPEEVYPTPLYDHEFISKEIKLGLPQEIGIKLLATLRADVEFLKQRKMMDYALVVGVVKFSINSIPEILVGMIAHFFPGIAARGEHYFISMEGFGSIYGARKRLEGLADKGGSRESVSIKPEKYAQRFLQFINAAIHNEETEEAFTTKTFELAYNETVALGSPRDLQEKFFQRRRSFQQDRALSGDDSGSESSSHLRTGSVLQSRPTSTGSDGL